MSNPTVNPPPRVRRDVRSLLAEGPGGRQVLDDYALAVESMRQLDAGNGPPLDPRSWRFQAAIHGFTDVGFSPLDPSRWTSCRHNSWFFLPWHRIYLYFFERIVQSHLEDPGWSLPYWDWSVPDDDEAQRIPEPFRVPDDPATNALYTDQRDPELNDPVSPAAMDFSRIDARPSLAIGAFSAPRAAAGTSFGGGAVWDTAPVTNARGSIENLPHGLVHAFVGGQTGWMGAFDTAGLDPIFWLHHANIDRLWDVWIGRWGAGALPVDPKWLDTEFWFFDGHGTEAALTLGEVLESASLGYVYESVEPPPDTVGPGVFSRDEAAPTSREVAAVTNPELVGATSDVSFARRTEVPIAVEPAARSAAFADAPSADDARWYVRVEDIVGEQPAAPAYDLYVNLPDGASPADHPDLRAGTIASFGIREATMADNGVPGLSDVFDITGVVQQLRASGWDEGELTVTVVPADLHGDESDGGDVHAGRISVYVG